MGEVEDLAVGIFLSFWFLVLALIFVRLAVEMFKEPSQKKDQPPAPQEKQNDRD